MYNSILGDTIVSGQTYRYTGGRIDILPSDATHSDREEYTAGCKVAADECDIGFWFENLKHVTIDFGGAALCFHGRIVPFVLDNCEDITLKNFSIDYDRPFYSQADILSFNGEEMEIRMCDGFDYAVKDGYLIAKGCGWEKNLNRNDCLLWPFEREGYAKYDIMLALFGPEVFPNENPPLEIHQLSVQEKEDHLIIRGYFPPNWHKIGQKTTLLITHEIRDKHAITAVGCRNVTVENCTLVHCAGMGFVGMHCENITLDRFNAYRNYHGNGRMVACNADAVHCFNCKGRIVVRNCEMEALLDDTVNIHSNYYTVDSVNGQTLGMVMNGPDKKLALRCFNEGDTVTVYRGRTQEPVAELVVNAIRFDKETEMRYYSVTGDTAQIAAGDTMENRSAQPEILLENNTFGIFRGTMRLQSRNKTVIRNCRFYNPGTSMLFTGDTTYWYESGPVQDLTVEDCAFVNQAGPYFSVFGEVEFTKEFPFYHKNITVKNCSFDHGGVVAELNHLNGFTFTGNISPDTMQILSAHSRNIRTDCSTIIERD